MDFFRLFMVSSCYVVGWIFSGGDGCPARSGAPEPRPSADRSMWAGWALCVPWRSDQCVLGEQEKEHEDAGVDQIEPCEQDMRPASIGGVVV